MEWSFNKRQYFLLFNIKKQKIIKFPKDFKIGVLGLSIKATLSLNTNEAIARVTPMVAIINAIEPNQTAAIPLTSFLFTSAGSFFLW